MTRRCGVISSWMLLGLILCSRGASAQAPRLLPGLEGKFSGPSASDSATDEDGADKVARPTAADGPLDDQPESAPAETWSPELLALQDRIVRIKNWYGRRLLNTRDHSSWEVFHRVIAHGVETEVLRGGPGGRPVNAIGWLCYGGVCKGGPLVYLDRGRVSVRKGVDVQGHSGQFLAILAQAKVMDTYSMRVGGKSFTIEDLIVTEQRTCELGTELTFKLIALSHYLDSEAVWQNDAGQTWSIPRLIQEEIKSPIRGAACGGTHRLMGLSYAVRERVKGGGEIDGEWLRAQTYVSDYHRYTFGQQNGDGSFSTDWFKRREARPDIDRRLQTTGHILEWMVYSVPDETLTDPRLVRAVNYLSGILAAEPRRQWEIGPLGHGIHALSMWEERLFHNGPAATEPLAQEKDAEEEQAETSQTDAPALDTADNRDATVSGPAPAVSRATRSRRSRSGNR